MSDPGIRRIDRLPGGVAALAERVPDGSIDECLGLLMATVVDLTGIGGSPAVREALEQWRTRRTVTAGTRSAIEAVLIARDVDGAVAHRAGDIDTQRAHFRAARAVACLVWVTDPNTDARQRFREAVYEAASAIGATAGVVAILADFVP
ncbi:MAG: hypothetical protein QM673_15180 [Gordonia sp. (in: high G+C Gram-positive bacteria)]